MLTRFLIPFLAVALLAAPALADDGEAPETVLQPVLDDDCCINPGEPGDIPLAPITDEVSEIVPGSPDDEPLEPVLEDDLAPNLPNSSDEHSSSSGDHRPPQAQRPDRRPETTFVVYVPMRPDGTRPVVELQAAKNGRDSEIWVDGAPRAVLKDRLDLTLDDLKIVYP